METDIDQLRKKLVESKPELKAQLDELMKAKNKLQQMYEKESVKNIQINGHPAILAVYKSGTIEIKFRDMIECKAAIEILGLK
jgi:hypothetical protein